LNEEAAIKEKQTNFARDLDRNAERAMRPMPDSIVYDLSVTNANLPGLPAPEPLTATNEVARLIATHQNGAISIVSTNDDIVTGIPLGNHGKSSQPREVIAKAQGVDPTLEETENILQDYISLLTTNHVLIANQ
jgi:hypothetical protein